MDDEPDSYFVDNVSFHEYGLGLAESEQSFDVYPNPAKKNFSINTEHNSIIEIYDVLGKRVERFTAKNYQSVICLLYTSPSPRDKRQSRMPSSA